MLNNILYALLIFSFILLFGYIGEYIFQKKRILPYVLIILLGILFGSIFHLIQYSSLISIMSYVSVATLLLIMFQGGIDITIKELVKYGWRPLFQVMLYVGISFLLVYLFLVFVLKLPSLIADIIASIFSGETSTIAIIPLSREINITKGSVVFLTLESSLNSVVLTLLFTLFISAYLGISSNTSFINSLFTNFSVGLVLGVLLGVIWLWVINTIKIEKYSYSLTLGLLFLSYVIITALNGNGFLGGLIFGLLIGNYEKLGKLIKGDFSRIKNKVYSFNREISFLLRSFFFFYLGLAITIFSSSFLYDLEIALALFLILLFSRFIAIELSTAKSDIAKDKKALYISFAQGLTVISLLTLAQSYNIPYMSSFVVIIGLILLFSNIGTTIGIYLLREEI